MAKLTLYPSRRHIVYWHIALANVVMNDSVASQTTKRMCFIDCTQLQRINHRFEFINWMQVPFPLTSAGCRPWKSYISRVVSWQVRVRATVLILSYCLVHGLYTSTHSCQHIYSAQLVAIAHNRRQIFNLHIAQMFLLGNICTYELVQARTNQIRFGPLSNVPVE